ncbi:hypothetical protein PSTG_13365 [Puccinia striiformis f. sp. tritici PST-78]|uniref:Uncharacterized protein n=1 Tax=Puccinia striiformis f. sp. tritici PST-78 TaxID=1165861 RepID=A0A0L0V1U4_9BASI|nr:hypothetical protein PSTG_13365 [Puccinia striiformis f. sp. tritici PST-78]
MPDHGRLSNHQDDNFGNDDDDDDDDDNNNDSDDDNDNYSDGNQGRAAESYPLVTCYVQHLNVTPSNQLVADEFFDMPPSQRDTILFQMLVTTNERLASMSSCISRLEGQVALIPAVPVIELHDDQASAWAPGEPLKNFGRKTARTYMLDSTVEAYTQGPGANDEAPSGTLLTLVMAKLYNQDLEYQQTHLPPKTGEHGKSRDQLVTCVVKEILRQVHNKARNVILAGMVEQQTKVKVPGIPDINKLSRLLWRHVRFAFLRLATIENLLDGNARNHSQWLEIDSLLAALCGQSHEYFKVWRLLVSERAHELFATSPMYDDSTSATLQTKLCPTDEDVHALMLNQPCCWTFTHPAGFHPRGCSCIRSSASMKFYLTLLGLPE